MFSIQFLVATQKNNSMNEIQKIDQDLSTRYDANYVEAIEQYLINGGEGVELTIAQQKILERYRFADEKIRQNNGRFKRSEIVQQIMAKFGVSRETAFKDIVNTEHIFCSSYPLNKRYEIGVQIEFFKDELRKAAEDKDRDAVAKIGKVLVSLYEIYPDVTPSRAKKNIVMQIVNNFFSTADDNNGKEMDIDEAIVIAENVRDDE
jgi:hypothetical protein